jgi:hypothetical protein
VYFHFAFDCQGRSSGLLKNKCARFRLIMVYVHYDVDCQGRSLGLLKRVLGLGLIMVCLYLDFDCQGRSLRLLKKGVLGVGLLLVYVLL